MSDINASNIIIKVIARNSRKKITTISGLPAYFSEHFQKKITHELGKRCAAGVSIICIEKKQKIIHIQGESTEKIIEYLIQLKIPEEKIKICGIY